MSGGISLRVFITEIYYHLKTPKTIKILFWENFYTQVISRILYFDMNLSGTMIAHRLKHEPPLARANSLAPPRVFHLRMLPYAIVSSYLTLFTLTCRSRRYSLCGTFPSWLLRRQPLAVRFYEDCSSIVSGLSSVDCSTVHIFLGSCIMRDFLDFQVGMNDI